MALITDIDELPEPACRGGYPMYQLEGTLDEQQVNRLKAWLRGQTCMVCNGQAFDHDKREYYEACGGVSHGVVVYKHDLENFFKAGPILD